MICIFLFLDLPDAGSEHFALTVKEIKKRYINYIFIHIKKC